MEGFTFPCQDNAIFPFLGWLGEEGKEESKFDLVTAHVLHMPRWCEIFWDSQFSFLHLYKKCSGQKMCPLPRRIDTVCQSAVSWVVPVQPFWKTAIFSRVAGLLQLLFLHWFLLNFVLTERTLSRMAFSQMHVKKGTGKKKRKMKENWSNKPQHLTWCCF